MKLLIAAGGTGGHIYPGIAAAEEFLSREKGNEVLFVGGHGLEERIIGKEGYKIKKIHVRGIIRKISLRAVSAPFISFIGLIESLHVVFKFNPDAVLLTGGYASFPVALAAKVLGKRTILQEQNVLPGFVNRILSRLVDVVALSFEGSLRYMKGTVTGNPVRIRIVSSLKLKVQSSKLKRILIMGGSQGARSINNAIINDLDKFKDKGIEITHLIGERDYDELIVNSHLSRAPSNVEGSRDSAFPFYHPVRYMYNMEDALSAADLVVSRAGATAIAEFLVMGLPMVLVPFPHSAERHQDVNADAIAEAGAAGVLKDHELDRLPEVIFELVNDKEKLKRMSESALEMARPDAGKKVVDLIYGRS